MARCQWFTDSSVPGGKYLVPGCLNRAVYGDHAPCHCRTAPARLPPSDRIAELEAAIADLRKQVAELMRIN